MEHLGVKIDSGGVSNSKLISRISNARSRLHQLGAVGLNPFGCTAGESLKIFLSLVRLLVEYALPLCPVDVDVMMEHYQLESQLLKLVLGSLGGKRCHRVTLRQLCRLPTILERKKTLTAKLLERCLLWQKLRGQRIFWARIGGLLDLFWRPLGRNA